MTVIRPAVAQDAQGIVELLNPILRGTTNSFTSILKTPDAIVASIAESDDNNWPFLVADYGQIAGVAHYFQFRKGPGYARTMEHTIYVNPSAQGTGIGRSLINSLQTKAHARGITSLIGGISGENLNAIAFHAALGFVEVGRLPGVGFKFDRSLDLVLMQKTLVAAPA